MKLFALGSALVLMLSGAAAAAPPLSCPLITDPVGDATYGGLPASESMDIVSADVVADGRLTAVIRVKKWSDTADPSELGAVGRTLEIRFTHPSGESISLVATLNATIDVLIGSPVYSAKQYYPEGHPERQRYADGRPVGNVAWISGSTSEARNEIRLVMPLNAVEKYLVLRKGIIISKIHVATYWGDLVFGTPGGVASNARQNSVQADITTLPGATYELGARSCVEPGLH